MVRSPALEVISYLKKTDFSKPATRYLFCILWKHKHVFSPRQSTRCFWKKVFCKPWQMVQMGWTALGRRCLSATPSTTVICRDGWCCTFPMVRKSTVTQQRVFFAELQPVSDIYLLLTTQLTSGWRTVRSCCPHPTTPLALISHYKPLNGYAISGSQMSTSSPRFVWISL